MKGYAACYSFFHTFRLYLDISDFVAYRIVQSCTCSPGRKDGILTLRIKKKLILFLHIYSMFNIQPTESGSFYSFKYPDDSAAVPYNSPLLEGG